MTHAQAVEKHAAERYLLDEMPELERYAFEAHYFECAECAEDVRAGALMQSGIREGLLGAATPAASVVAAPSLATVHASSVAAWRQAIPWAVAAMLAVTVGYQTLWVVPTMRNQTVEAQVLAPVTLRAATRGAEPTVARPAAGIVTFALDVNGITPDARLAYDLRTADGTSVASGTAAAPSPGTPLLLLIPESAVRAAGSYVLSVRAADTESAPVDYRFTITER